LIVKSYKTKKSGVFYLESENIEAAPEGVAFFVSIKIFSIRCQDKKTVNRL